MREALKIPALYTFPHATDESEVMGEIQSAFPMCYGMNTNNYNTVSCEQKRNALKKLRKAAFLMPNNLKFWEMLRCVHEKEGLTRNAEHYARLARGTRIPENEEKIVGADLVELIRLGKISVDDRAFFLKNLKQYPENTVHISDNLKTDKTYLLELIGGNGSILKYVPLSFKDDRNFLIEVVKVNPHALYFATEKWKNDPIFMYDSFKIKSDALLYASEELKNNLDFISLLININSAAYENASDELKKNQKVIDAYNNARAREATSRGH